MALIDLFNTEFTTYSLGDSSVEGISVRAIKASLDADEEDNGDRNAILFECGMHAREWFAAQSCYWLLAYLATNIGTEEVQELLSEVDVWILPQTNPGGRDLDDLANGDPTQFVHVCMGGTSDGNTCNDAAGDSACTAGGGLCYRSGWRTNANTAVCSAGVDLARNFSSDWDSALADCDGSRCVGGADDGALCTSDAGCSSGDCQSRYMKYRGPAPFSELENLALRQFIHNHMVTVVVITHANAQETWNLWAGVHGPSGYLTDELDAANDAGLVAADEEARMPQDSVGTGSGQFSAWLTADSDVAGELDEGTRRAISTFFLELPILSSLAEVSRGGILYDLGGYYSESYDGEAGTPDYQDASSDGSNSFHPSGEVVRDLWEDSVLPMQLYLIRQARSPQCPVDEAGDRIVSECLTTDVGLVGAKIAQAADQAGGLRFDAGAREELLSGGDWQVVYAVQDFSATKLPVNVTATVTIEKDGIVDLTDVQNFVMVSGQRRVRTVDYTFLFGSTYGVEIELAAAGRSGIDQFSQNDSKIFAFRTPSLDPTPIPAEAVLADGLLEVDPGPGELDFGAIAITLPRRFHPQQTGMQVVVRGYGAAASGRSRTPATLVLDLPAGSPWWDLSKPQQGLWVYSDPRGAAGSVRLLRIGPPSKQRGRRAKRPSPLRLQAEESLVRGLAGAHSYGVEMSAGPGIRLTGVALGETPVLPPSQFPPQDDPEEEPGG